MANALLGEQQVEAGDLVLTIGFDVDKICQLETRVDMGIQRFGAMMARDRRMSWLRAMFWASLRQHHPEISEKQSGELIPVIGADALWEKLSTALQLAFPKKKEEDGDAPPPKPAPETPAGTGSTS